MSEEKPAKRGKGRPKGAVAPKRLTREAILSKTIDKALSFMDIMRVVETEQGVSFIKHCFQRAYLDDKMAIALLKKLVPDLKMIEASVTANVDGNLTVTASLDLNEVLLQGLPKPPQNE
jgi:hypothetical protein